MDQDRNTTPFEGMSADKYNAWCAETGHYYMNLPVLVLERLWRLELTTIEFRIILTLIRHSWGYGCDEVDVAQADLMPIVGGSSKTYMSNVIGGLVERRILVRRVVEGVDRYGLTDPRQWSAGSGIVPSASANPATKVCKLTVKRSDRPKVSKQTKNVVTPESNLAEAGTGAESSEATKAVTPQSNESVAPGSDTVVTPGSDALHVNTCESSKNEVLNSDHHSQVRTSIAGSEDTNQGVDGGEGDAASLSHDKGNREGNPGEPKASTVRSGRRFTITDVLAKQHHWEWSEDESRQWESDFGDMIAKCSVPYSDRRAQTMMMRLTDRKRQLDPLDPREALDLLAQGFENIAQG